MIIWYLNHYALPPEHGSVKRPHNLARFFQTTGITFINFCASFHHLRREPAHSDAVGKIRLYNHISYYHVKTCKYRRNNLLRIANILGYTVRTSKLAGQIKASNLLPPDIIIASCAHIFSYLAASYLRKTLGAKIIYEVRDIWPLSLIQLTAAASWNPLILWMKHIEKKAYKEADAVVSLLPKAMDHMVPLGLDIDRFFYIPNGLWADEWNMNRTQLPPEHQRVFDWCSDKNKLKVVYTGSHGPPNALDQILAIKNVVHTNDVPYHFVLIGEGIQKHELISKARRQNINFIEFLPKVKQSQIPAVLDRADVCFIGWQKKPIYKLGISPNKLLDYFQAAKPILHAYSGAADPVTEAKAGISIEPYNSIQADEALRKFCQMTDQERRFMGNRGKQYALQNLEWSVLGQKYLSLCRNLTSG